MYVVLVTVLLISSLFETAELMTAGGSKGQDPCYNCKVFWTDVCTFGVFAQEDYCSKMAWLQWCLQDDEYAIVCDERGWFNDEE